MALRFQLGHAPVSLSVELEQRGQGAAEVRLPLGNGAFGGTLSPTASLKACRYLRQFKVLIGVISAEDEVRVRHSSRYFAK
jgi:hypothetical protein